MCIQNYSVKKVNIGNDVWIGTNAVITKGVNIGNRVIVAANSVVVNDLNCNAMYGGVPAKFIKNI
jgi:maltose O-acetyltransferase